jgi:TM2 domain-containing membrane protein YozV/ribosomal protein L12E/L44/L45/RPP1/RPP2
VSQEWYYSVDGDRQGPVSAADLKKLAEGGNLKPSDLVWKDGMADWAQAKSIKGLFGNGAAVAPAAAAPAKAEEPARARPRAEAEPEAEEDDRPSTRGRRRDVDDEDDRPRHRPNDDEEDDRPSGRVRRRDADDDEEEDRPVRRRDDDVEEDRPRKKKRIRVPEDTANKKMVAGLLGILLGGFAVHKFYLGFTGTAVLQLVISLLTCGLVGWLGLIEGIIYLTKSDEDFHRDYVVNQKQWF